MPGSTSILPACAMNSQWSEARWGDLVTLEYGRALRSHGTGTGQFRVFGTNGPIGWHDEPLCKHAGVIIGRKGAYRGVNYSPEPFFVIDTAFYLEPKTDIDLRWAYYELLTKDINSLDSGSAIPSTSRESFYQLPVRVPSRTEQSAIADFLGALDDKIELNQRMNETLEGIARALFRSWFVDFDAVRAKMGGRDPGLPSEIADLFPDRLVPSELGEIPEGWEVKTLGQVSEKPQYGYTASASDEAIGPHFLRITDINKQHWIDWEEVPFCAISDGERRKYSLAVGDIVFARIADPGHAALIEEVVDAVFASYLIRLRPLQQELGRFLQYWVRSDHYWNLVRSRQSGTTRANLNAQLLSAFPLTLPDTRVLRAFSGQVDPLRDKVVGNRCESRDLADIRDNLLPKLISGEIRVDAAREAAGA